MFCLASLLLFLGVCRSVVGSMFLASFSIDFALDIITLLTFCGESIYRKSVCEVDEGSFDIGCMWF